jgi:hypothetical protein
MTGHDGVTVKITLTCTGRIIRCFLLDTTTTITRKENHSLCSAISTKFISAIKMIKNNTENQSILLYMFFGYCIYSYLLLGNLHFVICPCKYINVYIYIYMYRYIYTYIFSPQRAVVFIVLESQNELLFYLRENVSVVVVLHKGEISCSRCTT